MELIKERERVANFMRRLYEQKLTTASGGNVSLRVGEKVLITASQTDKAKIIGEQVGVITLEGKNLSPRLKISMEYKMHTAIYSKRPDVKAIVHAHPVMATAFGIAGKTINTGISGEFRAMLGEPVLAPYALMGTQDLADAVSDAALGSNVVVMENHGVLAVGKTLFQAYDRMEVLEACARMNFITGLLGNTKTLTQTELQAIDQLFND